MLNWVPACDLYRQSCCPALPLLPFLPMPAQVAFLLKHEVLYEHGWEGWFHLYDGHGIQYLVIAGCICRAFYYIGMPRTIYRLLKYKPVVANIVINAIVSSTSQ